MAENPRIEELRRRVQADPASIAFAALAEEFRRVGRYDDAVETCRKGLLRHPAYLSARVTLGRALIETGDFDAAREQLQTVLRTAPENLVAIRALAEIEERLGHSTKMDPHVADVMNTMHEESLRVASVDPPAPPAPEPAKPIAPAAPPAFETFDDALDAALEGPPGFPADPFAEFAPRPAPRPAEDLSFDLSTASAIQPTPAPAPPEDAAGDLMMTPAAEPGEVPSEPADESEPVFQVLPLTLPETPVEFDLGIDADPEAPSETEPEPVLQMAAESGPGPEVLATLARLERFLGAIQSLRA